MPASQLPIVEPKTPAHIRRIGTPPLASTDRRAGAITRRDCARLRSPGTITRREARLADPWIPIANSARSRCLPGACALGAERPVLVGRARPSTDGHGGTLGWPHRCCGGRGVGVDQGGEGRVGAQLVEAAATQGPDAADRDTEGGADLGVGHGRVGGEQGEQLLGAGREVGECRA